MLTPRQKECLDFIVKYMRETGGVSPALTDIGDALGGIPKGAVHRLLTQLELRGRIRRLARKARAIEVLRVKPNTSKPAKEKITRDITIPKCGKPPKEISTLCPGGKINGTGWSRAL